MDSEGDKKARGAAKNAGSERRGKNTGEKAEKGRKVKKPYNCPTGTARGNSQKAPPKKIDQRKLLAPIKEQLGIALEYVHILEFKRNFDLQIDVKLLLDLMTYIEKQCEIYLNYQALIQKDGTYD